MDLKILPFLKFKNNKLSIILFIAIGIVFFILLKILVVREKWVQIIDLPIVPSQVTLLKDESILCVKEINLLKENVNENNNYPRNESNTIQKYNYKISLKETSNIRYLKFKIAYSKGFILYINDCLSSTSPNVLFDSISNLTILMDNYLKQDSEHFYTSPNKLKQGNNIIELYIISNNSLPKNFNPLVSIEANKEGFFITDFKKLKKEKKKKTASNLPVISINTNGKEIEDEKKIKATFEIHNTSDYNRKETNIKIELRGSSSKWHAQLAKSYSFNTYNHKWQKTNMNLLGLPQDSEWVLYSPYLDKSLIRNALAYKWASNTGHYAPKFKYCEVYINKEYMGVYLLVEKPGVSKNRVNYPSVNSEIYLCQIDRPDDKRFGWYLENGEKDFIYVNLMSPKIKYTDSTTVGPYLQKSLKEIHTAFKKPRINHSTIDSTLDVNAFIDFALINELAKNPDAYALSVFFSKTKNNPILFGPVWDFDIAFGNVYGEQWKNCTGWCLQDTTGTSYRRIDWMTSLLNDSIYREDVRKKWFAYRNDFLSNKNVLKTIDSLANILKVSEINHHTSMPILNRWVWPNGYTGGTYENEIYFLKYWILKRLLWIDKELSGSDNYLQNENIMYKRLKKN